MSAPETCWKSATMPRSTAARPELLSTGDRTTWRSRQYAIISQSAGFRHGAEPRRARSRMPREGLAVDRHQPKRRCIPQRPLEVVEQRPVHVAAHVDAFAKAGEDLPEGDVDVGDALLVVGGGDAALG